MSHTLPSVPSVPLCCPLVSCVLWEKSLVCHILTIVPGVPMSLFTAQRCSPTFHALEENPHVPHHPLVSPVSLFAPHQCAPSSGRNPNVHIPPASPLSPNPLCAACGCPVFSGGKTLMSLWCPQLPSLLPPGVHHPWDDTPTSTSPRCPHCPQLPSVLSPGETPNVPRCPPFP